MQEQTISWQGSIRNKRVCIMGKHLNLITRVVVLGFSLVIIFFSSPWAKEPLKVSVSILPQGYFVEKIGGELLDVSVMVRPGTSPHIYEPKPQQMVELTKSRIYFAIGVPFERVWLDRFARANPKMILVNTQEGIEKIPMETPHFQTGDRHFEGTKDPHVWLSPPLVMIQARNILNTLLRVDPSHRKVYETNYGNFMKEIVDLDLRLLNIFMNQRESTRFMVYHPSWGYFAKAYGLTQIPVEVEGKEPRPNELKEIIQRSRNLNVKVIFVQPQFSTKSAKTVADAIGCQIMFADPLEMAWSKNLLNVGEGFKAALR
ncbi:MAG: zinc ABC transporter substrate-binding protein [Pseudomonadota bacterium]